MKIIKIETYNENFTDQIVSRDVLFTEYKFLRYFGLICVKEFLKDVIFEGCIFEDIVIVHSNLFRKNLIFNDCKFLNPKGYSEFSVLQINGHLTFNQCVFEGTFNFVDSTILGKTSFYKCKFSNGINLFSKNEDSFGNVAFEGGLNIFR